MTHVEVFLITASVDGAGALVALAASVAFARRVRGWASSALVLTAGGTLLLVLLRRAIASAVLGDILRVIAPHFYLTISYLNVYLWVDLLAEVFSVLFGVALLVVLRRAGRDHALLAAAQAPQGAAEPS